MASSTESKHFRMERLLCDSQRENVQSKEMVKNDGNNEMVDDGTKGMGQKRKTMMVEEEEGIQIKSQKMEQSKTNNPPIAQPANSIPSNGTVSTIQIPQNGTSIIQSFPPNIHPQSFPNPFLSPKFPLLHFPSPPIGHPIQFFPSPATSPIAMNPFLAALIHQQKMAHQRQAAAFLQQMFMMTPPQSNLSTPGSSSNVGSSSSSLSIGSSGGNNSSIGGTPIGFWNPFGMMTYRNGQQQNKLETNTNAMTNRFPLKENKAELAANLQTPKNVRKGRNPVRRIKKEEDEVPAICEHCGKTFERHWLLNGHLRTHTGEKPFECDWPGCGRKFADQSNCRAHERTHRPEKPFGCQNCGKSFKLKSYLAKHQNAMVCHKEAKKLAKNE